MMLMSMLLVLSAWQVYRNAALDTQRQSLVEMLERETSRILQGLSEASEALVRNTQASSDFRQAFKNKDLINLERLLSEQFQSHQVISNAVSLVQLYAYNKDYEVIAWSNHGPSPRNQFGLICQGMLDLARQRQAEDQNKPLSGLCQWRQRTYYSLIMPVGDSQLSGYLKLVADPLQSMVSLEKFLKMPIRMTQKNGDVIYRSHNWHADKEGVDFVMAGHWLAGSTGEPMVEISVQHDLALFNESLGHSRNLVLVITALITFLIVVFVSWRVQQSTIGPVRQLTGQLNKVRQDRRQLGKKVELSGSVELRELVKVFNDMSQELAQSYEQYEELAFTDQLTELPNRALFLDRLKQLILLSGRKNEKFGVMLLDLDGFKDVNDTLGHHVGDELLKHIAFRLQGSIRASSTIARVADNNHPGGEVELVPNEEETTIARLGGDEYAILLPNLSGVDGAVAVAKRVTELLEPPAEIDGNLIVVAGTLGIAMFPEHGDNAETLLRRADVALYVAKHLQNDFSVYDPAYDRHSVKQLALKAELRAAIEEGQLEIHYQPKLNLQEGCVNSVEALVRWQHPERGMITPEQFIPLCEQRGLIGPLTEWVIQHVLQQYSAWQTLGIHLQVAVNLSSRVLYDLYLPSKIEKCLVSAGLPPAALSLEITEEATMVDPERAMTILKRLDDMGISLAIDDFGTGHSSLGYLKSLPVDEIKIDRSFVMEMESSENDAKIVHATIDLSHNLGLKVVAEGVESDRALAMLKSLNCDYAQGFYLSKPRSPDDLIRWLESSEYSCKTI